MQATVFAFDPQTAHGSVVTDDGRMLAFDARAFTAGGLRLLRPGQRIRADLSPEGVIVALTVSTLTDNGVSDG